MRKAALVSVLILLLIPLVASAPRRSRLQKRIQRKWKLYIAKSYNKTPWDKGHDLTEAYKGDELNFINDSAIVFYDRSADKIYTETWETYEVGASPGRNNGDQLWIHLQCGTEKLSISGYELLVAKDRLNYDEVIKGGRMWKSWIPAEDSVANQ